ncbi:MAG: inositol monophosphatase family protein [Candidatus Hadarchaeia archaeon]
MKKPKIETLIDIIEKSGEILVDNYRKKKRVKRKEDDSPVTPVDVKIGEFIRERLEKMTPSFSIISEELENRERKSKFTWIVDPLDGTTNYIHHIPISAIMVALCRRRSPIMGVVHFPLQDLTYHAEKGENAYLNGKRICVSNISPEEGLTIFGTKIQKKEVWSALRKARNVFSDFRMLGSAAMSLTKVAEGKATACFEAGIKPWDYLPPKIIVEEAGGKVTNIHNEEIDWESRTIVASNGKQHDSLLKRLRN